MATDLFRTQLLAARIQNRTGEAFFRRFEPLLFSESQPQQLLQQQAAFVDRMNRIVSQFREEIASVHSASVKSGLPAQPCVDRFVQQFSASAAAAVSCTDSCAAASSKPLGSAALLLLRPAPLQDVTNSSTPAAGCSAQSQPQGKRSPASYRLFEAHAEMLLDALESPDAVSRQQSVAADEEDSAPRHHRERGSVLLSPSKMKPADQHQPPGLVLGSTAVATGASQSASPSQSWASPTAALLPRVRPAVLAEFAEFLRDSRLAHDPAVRAAWARAVEGRILRKVEQLCDPLEQTRQFAALSAWKRAVVEPFIRLLIVQQQQQQQQPSRSAIPAAQRSEVEQWAAHCGDFLCRAVARRRLESVFDDIVDFPDSRPHLQDVADAAARQPSLLHDVARSTKAAITARLQHAGASTANVLFLLSQTCRALCVVRPGRAAGEALLRQVCDTTVRHLRARADAVAAVVAAITDTQTHESNAWARRVGGAGTSRDDAAAGGGGAGTLFGSGGGVEAAAAELLSDDAADGAAASGDGPDILRMLLSVLTVPVVVKEYCGTLSARLLRQKPGDVNIDSEKEVLERIKVLLGEDACANADVILKDFETSRRWCRTTAAHSLPEGATATIVSAACWPAPVSDGPVAKLRLHPQLAGVAERVCAAFHTWKQNQSLLLLHHHGFVEISVSQKDPKQAAAATGSAGGDNDDDAATEDGAAALVRRKFRVNLVAASTVLYLTEQQPRPLKDLAAAMQITQAELAQFLHEYAPQLFVIRGGDIELQTVAVGDRVLDDGGGGDGGADALRSHAAAAPALPAGLTQGVVDMLQQMLRSMIANTGPKSAAQIENAARVVGMFHGTSAEMRDVLNYFVAKGLICSDGTGTYKLKPTE